MEWNFFFPFKIRQTKRGMSSNRTENSEERKNLRNGKKEKRVKAKMTMKRSREEKGRR